MADQVTSMFVPQSLLDMVSPRDAQAAADQARNTFLWGLLSGDPGAAYNAAQNSGYNVLAHGASLAEAQRKNQIQGMYTGAAQDAYQVVPGTGVGTADPRFAPRTETGQEMAGPGYIPARTQFNTNQYLNDPRVRAAVGLTDPSKLAELSDPKLMNVNGFLVSGRDTGNIGKFMPKLADGALPVYDNQGNVVGQVNAAGTLQTISSQAGAKAGAEESAKAYYASEKVYDPALGQYVIKRRSDVLSGKAPGIADPGPLDPAVAAETSKSLNTGREKALAASNTLMINDEARKSLNNAMTGAGADYKLAIARGLNAVGLVPDATVADTESFMLTKARTVLDTVKQLGSGVSISNADRDFAERIAGGNITLNEQTIKHLLDIEDKISRQAITTHDTRVGQVFTATRPNVGGVGADYYRVPMPELKNSTPAAPVAGPNGAVSNGAARPSLNQIFNPQNNK